MNFTEFLRENRRLLAPVLLGVLMLTGNIFFGVTIILPERNTNTDLSTLVAHNKQAAAEKMQPTEDNSSVLQAQIESAESGLNTSAEILLTEDLASDLLDNLYQYADESSVEITTLQLQPSPPLAEDDPFEVKIFLLEVQGTVPNLMAFLIRARETAVPSVAVRSLSLVDNTLKMELRLYVSPYAADDIFVNLPEPIVPAGLMMAATPIPTLITASPTLDASVTAIPTATPTPNEAVSVVGPGIYDNNHPAIQYTAGTWTEISSYSGYGGSYHYSLETSAEMRLDFLGTGVAVQYVAFRNFGIFEVYIDSALWGEVDSYAEKGIFGQLLTIDGLSNGQHSLIIRNTDRRHAASEGNVLAIDTLYVLQANPTPTQN